MMLNFEAVCSLKYKDEEYKLGVNKTNESDNYYAVWKFTELDVSSNHGHPFVYTKKFRKDLDANRVVAIELNNRQSQRH